MKKTLEKVSLGSAFVKAVVLNKLTGKRTPIIGNLFITNRCNLKCFYCYPEVFNRNLPDFSQEQLFSQIDDLAALGTRVLILLGGEPLIRKDIGEIIEYAKSKKMHCETVTNGYYLPKRIKDLKKLDTICISLDGDRKSHDANRGEGSYDKAVAAVRLAVDHGMHTRVHMTVTKNNLGSLEYLAEFAQNFDIPLHVGNVEFIEDHPDVKLTDDEIRGLLARVVSLKKRGYPIINGYAGLKHSMNIPYSYREIIYKSEKRPKHLPCKRPDFTAYIDVDGKMYPCAHMWRWKKEAFNVVESGVEKAWDQVRNVPCVECGSFGSHEMNLFLRLKPSVLRNVFSYMVRPTKLDKSTDLSQY